MGRPTLAVEPGEWPLVKLSRDERARYVGGYDEEGYQTEVREAQGVLEMTLPGGGTFDLIPEGEHSFAAGRVEGGQVHKVFWPSWRVVFVLDEDGQVVRYELRTAGEVGVIGTRVR